MTIAALLAAQAAERPDAPAILAPGRDPLTYRRLYEGVGEAVLALNRMGIGRGDRVAVVLPNGPEMAMVFLAVSSAAVCAPLNPAYRANEFEFYLTDLHAKALIMLAGADSPAREIATAIGIPIIELTPGVEAGLFTLRGTETVDVATPIFTRAEDQALVLHTSGTTSRPKIVPLTQANLCVSTQNIAQSLALTPDDRCLNIMPLFHIHGLAAALLASLSVGASVACTPGFSAPSFFPWLEELRPTWYTAVPTMHQAILTRAEAHRETIARVPLRFIRSCSAALPPTVMAELERVFGVPALEAYGMTEAAHQMASNPLPPRPHKAGSVGVAAGPEIAIMDEAGMLLGPSETGEVVIRGANVTAGYESNPQANAGAFTNGWFRTGDQGYLDEEGYLFLTGRLKELINRGGEKIAPREIDEALLSHDAVAQALAFAMPHPQLGEAIAAAVVLREGAAATERELQTHAAARLSDFKVPARILILPEIPKGPTGKPQRIGLAEKLGLTANEPPTAPAEYVAPRTGTEAALAVIWAEALKLAQIGMEDNFFALGGDSILAAQIVARVCEHLSADFTLFLFLESPTVAAQAAFIDEQRTGEDLAGADDLLAELEGLAEEEVERLLAEELK
ncbi:MAG: AMP-binding protein [Armatimonadota bacterium]